ncbi:MAG TPA: DNA cytosine methyltransferase [Armatimonadota bacterium]|nr:DNA cytosine methyltransferase [Armatimonadota bacterium]
MWHIQGDALEAIHGKAWDLVIAFPPCTYLTNSNAWRWDAIAAERAEALDFVRAIMGAPVERIAVENPVGAIGTQIRKADQYIQPWQFGEPFQKTTGLWLKNLPKLRPEVTTKPDNVVPYVQAAYGPRNPETGKRTAVVGRQGAKRSGHERSRTFRGIARAMAEQWG